MIIGLSAVDGDKVMNYGVLQKNTLDGLSETAGALYLKLLDTYQGWTDSRNERKAFIAACFYEENFGQTFGHILDNFYKDTPAEVKADLSNFSAERYRNNML